MSKAKNDLSLKRIFVFWAPLAATWMMMATEGPFLAAIIARLDNPKFNLAAYGVAFSLAVLIESPIIMIMSASTALVKNRDSYFKLRNFTFLLNGAVTLIMVLLLIPPVFDTITLSIMKLNPEVAELTQHACLFFIPWPAAIGYRRFYQGILVRSNLTRRVAYGTVIRLSTMAVSALSCYLFTSLPGAVVGTLALSTGVTAEAAASRMMAHSATKRVLLTAAETSKVLDYPSIARFYYPLALTSILSLGIHPLVTFFMGQSRMPLESLAVLPVINSLIFVFRSLGLSFQEVSIALLGEKDQGYRPLKKFAAILGIAASGGLALIGFSPLAAVWFHDISGLTMELTHFSLTPARILCLIPGLSVLLSFQRSLMVNHETTKHVTIATAIEILSIFSLLMIFIRGLYLTGAIAAAISMTVGRLFANIYLLFPCSRVRQNRSAEVTCSTVS